MLILIRSHFLLTVSRMLVLIGLDYSLVSLGIDCLSLLGFYYLLQLFVLLLLWFSFSWLIVLLLVLHSIDLIVLHVVLVLVVLVAAVDVLVSVLFVAKISGHFSLAVVHIQVVIASVVFVIHFPQSFVSPTVLLLLLLFVVLVYNRMVPGYGCHLPLFDDHWFCCCRCCCCCFC